MARLRARIPVKDDEGNIEVGATVKLYAPGTASVVGSVTTGTPFAGNLYDAITGGSPGSTTRTSDANGEVIVFTDTKSRIDIGIETSTGVRVAQYEEWMFDPADVLTSFDTVISVPAGEIAAPGLSQAGNTDTGFGVDSGGDPFVAKDGIGILEVLSTSTYLRSPNGTYAGAISNAGIFTAPGLLRMLGWYIVSDHGLVAGASSGLATTNAAALTTLWSTVAANGGGVIYFPSGVWSLDPVTLNHGLGYSVAVTLMGSNSSSILKFYGGVGPFLNIATASGSALSACGIEELYINHSVVSNSGATVRLGYTSRYHLANVNMSGNEALIGLQLITQASVHVHDSTITVQDAAGGICVDFAHTVSTGGIQFTGCDLSGGLAAGTNTRGLRFNNSTLIDTVVLNNTSIKDHYICIASASNTGDVANFQMNGGFIDGSQYGMSLQPSTGADYGSFAFNNVWMSSESQIAILSTANGGTVSGVSISGESWHNATLGGMLIQKGVDGVKLTGIRMGLQTTNDASYSGILLETSGGVSPSSVAINGCQVVVGASTSACITAPAAATPLTIVGNELRGSADADGLNVGATGTARVVSGNSYAT